MKKYIIPGFLIIFTGMLAYQTYNLKIIKEDLDNLKSTNISLQENVSSLGNVISSEIQSTLNEELAKSYLTKDVNFNLNKNTDKGYDLTVRAELSELKGNSTVLFMYKDKDSKNWQEVELKKDGELSYVGDFTLSYDNNYKYKIVIKGDKIESSDVQDLENNLFIPQISDVSWSYNDEGIYFYAQPYFEEIEYEALPKNKIKTIEIIVNNKSKAYKCEYKEESMYDENDEFAEMSKYYETNIPKEAYNNKIDSIKMKVIYESGIFYIEDITNRLSE